MIKAGIVGGTGYTGVELLRLLARHSGVELTAITSRGEAGTPVADMFPSLRGAVGLNFSDPKDAPLDGLRRGVLRHPQRHRHAAGGKPA
jgi:N-acetyl-gamma-glutamyl-phosphate reductase